MIPYTIQWIFRRFANLTDLEEYLSGILEWVFYYLLIRIKHSSKKENRAGLFVPDQENERIDSCHT